MGVYAYSKEERLKQWEEFKKALALHDGDVNYNSLIREKGFDVRNMCFSEGAISFSILTTYAFLIPYSVLAGGFLGCMTYIMNEIQKLKCAVS